MLFFTPNDRYANPRISWKRKSISEVCRYACVRPFSVHFQQFYHIHEEKLNRNKSSWSLMWMWNVRVLWRETNSFNTFYYAYNPIKTSMEFIHSAAQTFICLPTACIDGNSTYSWICDAPKKCSIATMNDSNSHISVIGMNTIVFRGFGIIQKRLVGAQCARGA